MNYDESSMPASYDVGRGYSPEVLQAWLNTISRSVEGSRVSTILDLGCGTGRYSNALAEHFDAYVEALDPSEKMLNQAAQKPHERVHFGRARGEQLPLADSSVDLVFVSMVFHHFDSPHLVARECRRVLRSRGSVCVRNGTTNQIPNYPYVPFFRDIESILRADLPSRASIEAAFAAADFYLSHHELVMHELASSWEAYAKKLAHRADSMLMQLSDDDFESGIDSLRQYAHAHSNSGPVTQPIEFFAFRQKACST